MSRDRPLATVAVKDMKGRIHYVPADQIIAIVDNGRDAVVPTLVMLLNGRRDIESPDHAPMIVERYVEIVTGTLRPLRISAEPDGFSD